MHFANHDAPPSCWTCQYYGGPVPDNHVNGLCRHPRLSPVVSRPEYWCAFWVCEPGADDEPAQP